MHFLNVLPLSSYFPTLLGGALETLWLTLLVYVLVVVAATMLAVARHYRRVLPTYILATIFVEVTRNVPALAVLYLVYFGLPQFGIPLSQLTAGVVVLTAMVAGYLGEALRGALAAIPGGHWDAAEALGLHPAQTLIRVALPQMYLNAWPSLVNYLMIVLFGTSILSVIDIHELANVATTINDASFEPFPTYIYTLILYFALSSLLQLVAGRLHHYLDPAARAGRSRRWAS